MSPARLLAALTAAAAITGAASAAPVQAPSIANAKPLTDEAVNVKLRRELRAERAHGMRLRGVLHRERLHNARRERQLLRIIHRAAERVASSGISASTRAVLERIAACESGGDPRAISPGGTYEGLFQFDRSTWASVGGSGSPATASEAEQYERAALLYARRGSQPWPVCG